MKSVNGHLKPGNWRPQAKFYAHVASNRDINRFNEEGGFGVFIDKFPTKKLVTEISGSLTSSICFWETQSSTGFVTKPKFRADLVTLRFVISGEISYLRRDGEVIASKSIAALTGFDDVREVRASDAVRTVSATIALAALRSAYEALTGEAHISLPDMEPISEMTRPGMTGLLSTIRLVQRNLQDPQQSSDLLLPIFQEIMSYQLLSSWPKHARSSASSSIDLPLNKIKCAVDYIETNISSSIMLSEIAAAAGISVRVLQENFKKELGLTPVQYIIQRRLTRAHEDLLTEGSSGRSIRDIALSWGFAHMGDFGQRYRRLFGCTPSQTRHEAGRGRRNGPDLE